MARKKRIWYPGATYHVMSRGNRRTAIFTEPYDYLQFYKFLLEMKERFGFHIHAICLMTNHFHMAIETCHIELWKIMQKLLSIYASYYNHKYHYSGHLFEGRYEAKIIEDERYFLEVSRYIHLNPVKAKMVREPVGYEYSSYKKYVCMDNKPKGIVSKELYDFMEDLLETSRVLGAFGHNSRDQYRMFVEGKISHAEQELLIQKDMKEDDMWLPW